MSAGLGGHRTPYTYKLLRRSHEATFEVSMPPAPHSQLTRLHQRLFNFLSNLDDSAM
jgi:hypothetical protein